MDQGAPGRSGQMASCLGTVGLCAAVGFVGCGGEVPDQLDNETIKTHAFRVAADPPGGDFTGSVTVSLHSEEPATIYYTTDGQPPTDSGIEYTEPFEIDGDTILKIVGVDAEGRWSKPTMEYYSQVQLTLPPRQSPRILSLSRPHVYFSAQTGDNMLEQTLYATSVGTHHVMIHSVYIRASAEVGGYYEPGVFTLETPIDDATLLAPGETIALRVSYRPSDTLRSAALTFETDDMRTDNGVHEIKLSGRIFNW